MVLSSELYFMGYKKRVDNNQAKVVAELRNLGFTVALTHVVGKGFPDFIVGFASINYMVELKYGDNSKLTIDEINFFKMWGGQINLHRNTSEILYGFSNYLNSIGLINKAFDVDLLIMKYERDKNV